jgi:hypothetical protein
MRVPTDYRTAGFKYKEALSRPMNSHFQALVESVLVLISVRKLLLRFLLSTQAVIPQDYY